MERTISFIIPAYNAAWCLEKALDSLLVESCLGEIEIIVVNDGSTDGTEALARRYAERWPGVVSVLNKENGGHGSALNAGIQRASGRYLKVIDADDWIVSENLPAFLKKLRDCTADVVLTPFHQVDMADGSRDVWRMYCKQYERPYSLEEICGEWKSFDRCCTFHGVTYRTEFYRAVGYELSEGIFYEDQEYASIPFAHARSVWPIDLFLYQYLVGNGEQSVSDKNRLKRLPHVEQVTRRMLEYLNAHPELTEGGREYLYRKTEVVILSHYVVCCLIQPDKRKGRRDMAAYDEMIRGLDPVMYERIRKKAQAYRLMSRLHLSKECYQRLLASKLYSILRKSHRIEKESEG